MHTARLFFIVRVLLVFSIFIFSGALQAQLSKAESGSSLATKQGNSAALAFARIKGLAGSWEAPLHGSQEGKTMVDLFRVIGSGSAVLHEEWLDDEQLTATLFYVVGSELRADHYCDMKNQPRYSAVLSGDPNVLQFELREITNLSSPGRHFHGTTWKFIDGTHLTQDWISLADGKQPKVVRLKFTRKN